MFKREREEDKERKAAGGESQIMDNVAFIIDV